jgi:hypothetical protein
MFSGVFW